MPIYFLSLLFLARSALAAEADPSQFKISSLTNAGQGNFSEDLSVNGDHPAGRTDESGRISWSAGYTRSHLPVGTTVDNTNALDLSLSYRKSLDAGIGFTYSKTPEENLSSAGPSAWLGWEFPLGKAKDDGFRPTLEPKVTAKTDQYEQSFQGTATRPGVRRTIPRPVTGSEAIRQNTLTGGLDFTPVPLLSVHVEYSAYSYNRDVAKFLSYLDTPRAVARGIGTFSDTLGGFAQNGVDAGLSLYPAETWTLQLDASREKLIVGGSSSTGEKIELLKDFGAHWKVGLGFDHEVAAGYGQENLTMLDLGYTF